MRRLKRGEIQIAAVSKRTEDGAATGECAATPVSARQCFE